MRQQAWLIVPHVCTDKIGYALITNVSIVISRILRSLNYYNRGLTGFAPFLYYPIPLSLSPHMVLGFSIILSLPLFLVNSKFLGFCISLLPPLYIEILGFVSYNFRHIMYCVCCYKFVSVVIYWVFCSCFSFLPFYQRLTP